MNTVLELAMEGKSVWCVQAITDLVNVQRREFAVQDVGRSMQPVMKGVFKAKIAREVENARANQGITYSEAVQRVGKWTEQVRKVSEFAYKEHELKKTVDAATQTTGGKEMGVQANGRELEENT